MPLQLLESRLLLAGGWRHAALTEDVDASGYVALNDALLVVSDLRNFGIPHDLTGSASPAPPYHDPTGDDLVALDDLLQIVTVLRQGLGLPAPSLEASLQNDTGGAADGVTSDPTIAGRITANLHPETRLLFRTDDGPWSRAALEDLGGFTVLPGLALDGSADGAHSVQFAAQTAGGPPTLLALTFTLEAATVRPEFPAIGPLLVTPGQSISTQLEATSAGGDPVTFAIHSDAPLPTGALRNDGALEFSPTLAEIGVYHFELSARDGKGVTRQTVMLTVAPDAETSTRIAGVIRNTLDEPLEGVPIEVGAQQTTTAADGSFVLVFDEAPTTDEIIIHGEQIAGAATYPHSPKSLTMALGHPVYPGEANTIERPIYLAALDIEGAVTVDPSEPVTVVAPAAFPGARLTAQTDGITDAQGNPFTGQISLTEVPLDRTVLPLPENMAPEMVATIQPYDVRFATPAKVSAPNRMGYESGRYLALWSLRADTGQIEQTGLGRVSNDGTVINTVEGGVHNGTWWWFYFIILAGLVDTGPFATSEEAPAKDETQDKSCNPCVETKVLSSEAVLHSGAYVERHTLPAYQSQGASRGLALRYDSLRADPRPVTQFSFGAHPPEMEDAQSWLVGKVSLHLGAFRDETASLGDHFWSLENFDRDTAGERMGAAMQLDLRGRPSGVYRYSMTAGVRNENPTTNAVGVTSYELEGELPHVNESESPFGAGWSLEGWQRIVENSDGTLLLIDGDGTELIYRPSLVPTIRVYLSPTGDFSKMEQLPDGRFQRTMPDGMVYDFNEQNLLASVTDRNGNQTQYVYDESNRLTKIVDPVGLETILDYADGKVRAITDPAGRTTRLMHDTKGNLQQIVNPDESRRSWSYDERHLIVGETTPRGFIEQTFYDEFGRVSGARRADGSEVSFTPVQSQGLAGAQLTANLATAPDPDFDFRREAVFIDGNGHRETIQLDRLGQRITATDEVGATPTITRNGDNLIIGIDDARGNRQRFSYDTRGNLVGSADDVSLAPRPQGDYFPNPVYDFGGDTVGAADLNGDGWDDLVTTSYSAFNKFVVWANLGNGEFGPSEYPLFSNPEAFGSTTNYHFEDVNGDGAPDLYGEARYFIFIDGIIHSVGLAAVALGDGEGGFLPPQEVQEDDDIRSLAMGDLNGDGLADLVTVVDTTLSNSQIRIWLQGPDGSFAGPNVYDTRRGEVRLTDVNGDGDLDLTFVRPLAHSRQVFVGLGAGDGSFAPLAAVFDQAAYTERYAWGDVNGDGHVDFVALGKNADDPEGDEVIEIVVGDGAGGFHSAKRLVVPWPRFVRTESGLIVERQVALADLDGDAKLDVLVNSNAADLAAVFYNRGDGEFSAAREFVYPTKSPHAIFIPGDFNGDGATDLATDRQILQGDGQGNFVARTLLDVGGASIGIVLDDFDGDGDLDLVSANRSKNTVDVLRGDGAGAFDGSASYPAGAAPQSMTVADLNGDQRPDIVLGYNNETIAYLLNQGGTFADPVTIAIGGVVQVMAAADFNNDGRPDLAAVRRDAPSVLVLLNDGAGGFAPQPELMFDQAPNVLEAADLEGDGRVDLVIGLDSQILLARGAGDGSFALDDPLELGLGAFVRDVALDDFNLDGQLDLVVADHGDGYSIFTSSADAYERSSVAYEGAEFTHRRLVLADVDGDTVKDLVGLSAGAGVNLTIELGVGGGAFRPPLSFAAVGDIGLNPLRSEPALGDVDGDGDLDIAVFNENQRTLAVIPNLSSAFAAGRPPGRSIEYDAQFGQPTVMFDELGRRTTYLLDPATGNVLTRTQQNSQGGDHVSHFEYASGGLLASSLDTLGRENAFGYDNRGRLTSFTFASGTPSQGERQFEHDDAGNLTTSTDENGNRTEFEYDAMNRLTRVRDPLGNETRFEYDVAGNLLRATDARGNVTLHEYDERNRLVKTTAPVGGVTQYEYDDEGNLLRVVDPLGHATSHEYDARNRRIQTTDAEGGVTRYEYDLDNNLIGVIDPVGNETRFDYDQRSRMIREIDPLGAETHYAYDAVDNLIGKLDRNGRKTEFVYDDLDRLVRETWLNASGAIANLIIYDYDQADNLTAVDDFFSALAFEYDERDRMTSVDNAGAPGAPQVLLEYEYDGVGNVLSVSDTIGGHAGGVTSYVYDALNRVERITQTGAGVNDKRVDFRYNELSQFATIRRFSDLAAAEPVVASTYQYDARGRLESLTHARPSGTVAFYEYVYDASSRITSITDIDGATTYAYDDRNQLTGADHAGAGRPDESYAYDANGNRTSSHLHEDGYLTGPGNRLLSDGVYNYAYDTEGNLIRRTEIATGDYRILRWDHRNRIVAVEDFAADETVVQIVQFAYDVLDRRVSKSVDNNPADLVGPTITHFVYDRDNVLLDFVDPDGIGPTVHALFTQYLHGPAVDQVLAQDKGEVQWLLADHLGTIRDFVVNAGIVVNHLSVDSFGNILSQSDPMIASRYVYTGREFDAETDYYFYRARSYDSENGRFLSIDPIGFASGEANAYRYASGNPISFNDPEGLDSAVVIHVGPHGVLKVDSGSETRYIEFGPSGNAAERFLGMLGTDGQVTISESFNYKFGENSYPTSMTIPLNSSQSKALLERAYELQRLAEIGQYRYSALGFTPNFIQYLLDLSLPKQYRRSHSNCHGFLFDLFDE